MNYVFTCSARISKKNEMLPPTSEANYKAFMWSHALEAMQDLKSMRVMDG